MKNFIYLLAIILPLNAVAQMDSTRISQNDLLVKSKNQKTAGYVVAGTGIVLASVGLIIGLDDLGGIFDPADQDNSTTSAVLMVGGVVVTAASIPLFVASARNKKKFQISGNVFIQKWQTPGVGARNTYPALGLRISF